jgi:hypothetical protein
MFGTIMIDIYSKMLRTIMIDIYSKMLRTIMIDIYSKMFGTIMLGEDNENIDARKWRIVPVAFTTCS